MCKTYFHFSRNQDVITGILNFTLRVEIASLLEKDAGGGLKSDQPTES
jgi:hypothetical protein